MAPTKPKSGGPSKGGPSKGGPSKGGPSKGKGAPSKSTSSSKVKKPSGPKPKPTQQKTKASKHGPQRKKRRVYSEKELGIPTLNSIKPAGIQKPHGMKKGKTFVDDKESMMTILAMVQAEKEGNIESKMMRARQMEEIREARKAETEKRESFRSQKLEDKKEEIRHRKRKATPKDSSRSGAPSPDESASAASKPLKLKKRVSFR